MDIQQTVLLDEDADTGEIQSVSYDKNTRYRQLKAGIWVYFMLLIFEGALRKWVLPGLATPLLIIRDPVAIWLFIMAWKQGALKPNIYIAGMYIIGVISFFTAIFFGHGNFVVALFGFRTLALHWPLIFIIGEVFNRDDMIKMGRFMVWLLIPMTVLIILQFYSPQSAWVNRGVGGDMKGAGFTAALGRFRPPGTFSFTNGTGLFYGLASCFVFYFWLSPRGYIQRGILIAGSLALLMAIPFSISRALFFSVIVIGIFSTVAASRNSRMFTRMGSTMIALLALFILLKHVSIFNTATETFTTRFTTASKTEGGLSGTLIDRYLGGMVEAITNSNDLPFFGYGLGLGTNVGSALTTGTTQFLFAEAEWGRLIGEMGIVLGLLAILLRMTLSLQIAVACYRRLKLGDIFPWILLSYCLLNLPQGQWSQPTSLGFCIVSAGFAIAALNLPGELSHLQEEDSGHEEVGLS